MGNAAAKAEENKAEEKKTGKGNGSYGDPYVKRDGTPMVKWSLTVPREFMLRVRAFSGHLDLNDSVSSFVMRAVDEQMQRENERRKKHSKKTGEEP